jgi:hypothetical protein
MKLVVSSIFILLLGGLVVADAMLVEGWPPTAAPAVDVQKPGVVKQSANSPLAILAAAKLAVAKQSQPTLLEQVITNKQAIERFNILDDNTPIGSIAWYEGLEVNDYFIAMRESLFTSFSSSVKDLQDTTVRKPGSPTVEKLEFNDQQLAPGTTVFMRVRQRLYEIHIEDGFELDMRGVINKLTD